MARLRRTSKPHEIALRRLSGLKSIMPPPNLGPKLSVQEYEAIADTLGGRLESHNQKIGELDDDDNDIDDLEVTTKDWNRRVLSAIEAQYGPDSSEYELVGGTRKSDRKRSTRKGGSDAPKP